jgi:hypothetical protein
MRNAKLPLLAVTALVAALPAPAGVYFSAVTTSEGAPGAAPASTTVRCWVQGDKARIEFAASADPLLARGRYLLTLDGGRSVYLVDPTERTFSEWSGDAAVWTSAAAARLTQGAVEKLDEGDGGELLGMKTVHVRYRAAAASAAGAVEEELWVAPELAEAALGVWMRRAAATAGGDETSAAARAERERLGSFPLKRVAVSPAGGRGSGKAARRTTMVVTELSVEDVSPGTFTMGSGFREKPLSANTAAAGQQAEDATGEFPQEDQQYPFEEMVQPEPQAPPTQPQPGQPAMAPQPGAHPPAVAPTPVPVVVPEEPQEDPVYPFERMLDSPN